LFCSPLSAQVFNSGPSSPALFDSVIDIQSNPNINSNASVGSDGLTTQLNILAGGSIGEDFDGSDTNFRVTAYFLNLAAISARLWPDKGCLKTATTCLVPPLMRFVSKTLVVNLAIVARETRLRVYCE